MTPQAALTRIIEHREIFHEEMLSLMRQIMSGAVSPTLIAAIITGLRVKKETIGEIAAAAQVMREFATKVPMAGDERLVDTCGTGGDAAHSFNISTAAAFVAAAAGAKVAKHGGRSVSSKSGSADVLEALGADINLSPENVARSIMETGVGFMFAPNHHSAMKHAGPVRKELGVRTIFNILGPLTNPAGAKNQVMGVFHPDLVGIQAHVLQRLGSRHVMIVHGLESLDEISVAGPTLIGELKDDDSARVSDQARGLRPGHARLGGDPRRQRRAIESNAAFRARKQAGRRARHRCAQCRREHLRRRVGRQPRRRRAHRARADGERRRAQESRPVRQVHSQSITSAAQ